jgi:hypothetical protein
MSNGKGVGGAYCTRFHRGFIGAAAELLTVTLVFYSGIGPALGVKSPLSLAPLLVYRPLVWGGLRGLPLAFILRSLTGHYGTVGFLYFPRACPGSASHIPAAGRNWVSGAEGRSWRYASRRHR